MHRPCICTTLLSRNCLSLNCLTLYLLSPPLIRLSPSLSLSQTPLANPSHSTYTHFPIQSAPFCPIQNLPLTNKPLQSEIYSPQPHTAAKIDSKDIHWHRLQTQQKGKKRKKEEKKEKYKDAPLSSNREKRFSREKAERRPFYCIPFIEKLTRYYKNIVLRQLQHYLTRILNNWAS